MKAKFTTEATQAVIASLRAGRTISEAAEDAGVASQTLRNWLSTGRAERGTELAVFASLADAARDEAAHAPLDEDEFHDRLNAAVRAGSIQALRLWWAVNREHDEERPPDALDALRAQREARRQPFINDNANAEGAA
jgi:transposase-like protein